MNAKSITHLDSESSSPAEVNSLLIQFQSGNFATAKKLALAMTKDHPSHLVGWKILAAVNWQLGQNHAALQANQKVVELASGDADAHCNLGITLKAAGRLEDAEASYRKAIDLDPRFAEAYSNLGSTLKALGRLEEAEESYKEAIVLKPNFAQAHSNLGNTQHALGRLADAEKSHRRAIALKPNYAQAHSNLGATLKALGRLTEAESSFRQAITLAPNFVEAHSNLSVTLYELGRLDESLSEVITSIGLQPTAIAKNLFVRISKYIAPHNWDPLLSEMVTSALLEPWARPSDAMGIACRLTKLDSVFIQELNLTNSSQANLTVANLNNYSFDKSFVSSKLLHAMLSSSHVSDHDIELYLTNLRNRYLWRATSDLTYGAQPDEVPITICCLAKQCFINEYVYFQTEKEIQHVRVLVNTLTNAIAREKKIQASLVIAVACYVPLNSISGSERLLHRNWNSDVVSVLVQQIKDPHEEVALRAYIPLLTNAVNAVSLDVQKMYEENPYPRWVRLPEEINARSLNTRMLELFSSDVYRPLPDDKSPEILIAGCGTGQHPIGTAQLIKGSSVLAIDLSIASLSYAKRKAIELGIENIEFAQADLLKLASLGRAFDVIESVGVLHHLDNPFEGLEVLLSLLKPQGSMKLGFYSERARRDIVRVRDMIDKEGTASTPHAIRSYRRRLFELKDTNDFGMAISSSDFFSTSACRDLLFHVKEHRMTLPDLTKFMKDHELNFLGFEIDSSVKRAYRNRFPDDPKAIDLDKWDVYEEQYPDTFSNMYQFWVQKT